MNDKTAPSSGQLQALSLTTLAQQEIERMILRGEFAPGERINEYALANLLGISRGPVREACRALAAMGLVQLIPNRGVFTRAISEDEAREVYEMRAGLFGYAGRLLAPHITDGQLDHLNLLVAQMDAAAKANDFDRYYAPNLTFHDYLVSATGNQRLIASYHDLVRQLHLFRARGLVAGTGMKDSNREHREIVAALTARDPQRAFDAMAGHVFAGQRRALGDDKPVLSHRAERPAQR
ncbi:FCD domain-containing protein [Litchfieldella rifensis]|uniref:FCD domain-containing protein n=1 Tax=Litchfieldella rifensis TaxID=762643 RepID=A0ABV7LM33_9GAMM